MSRHIYTPEQLQFLREEYRRLSLAELVVAFNQAFHIQLSASSVRGATRNHGMKSGRTGRIEKGAVSWNKGTNYNPGGRSVQTRFKPGARPHTWVPIGTEVFDRDGYLKRKVRDDAPPGMSRRNWEFVHRLVWKEHHGEIPAGQHVHFRDGNRSNITIENLVLVTPAQKLIMNRTGYSELQTELRQPARTLAQLKLRQYEVEKKHGLRKPGPGSKVLRALDVEG